VWDEAKNEWLKRERGISFEEIEGRLVEGRYIEVIGNPVRAGQQYFVMSIRDYNGWCRS